MRAQSEELGLRVRGGAFEARRRLSPVFAAVQAVVGWVAPYISRALLLAIKLLAALIALIAELGTVAARSLTARGAALAAATRALLRRRVTPLATVAFVGCAAAVGLGVSQFFDYHGVAVDAPNYAGEVGVVAPAPVTGTASAGSAHLWILLPVAVAAFALVVASYLGRTRLAGAVAVCGLLGVAVALAIDLPQGLDAGRAGLAFSGSDAELLQGFWAELACSATLMLCGGLLTLYSRDVTASRRGRSGALRRRRARRTDVDGVSPGLQAES